MRRARSLVVLLAVLVVAAPIHAQQPAPRTPALAAGSARGAFVINSRRCDVVAALGTLTFDLFDETKASVGLTFVTTPIDEATRKLSSFKRLEVTRAPYELDMTISVVRAGGKAEADFLSLYDPQTYQGLPERFRVEVERYTDTSMKGRVFTEKPQSFVKVEYEFDIAFDVELEPRNQPPVGASSGARLPAGGDDAGAAYVAAIRDLSAATTYEELYAVSKRVTSTMRGAIESPAELEAARLSIPQYAAPEKRVEWIRRNYKARRAFLPPQVPTVTGGFVNGDRATLSLRWVDSKVEMEGRVNMQREGGMWKLGFQSSRNEQ
jgi:hypothetical protein